MADANGMPLPSVKVNLSRFAARLLADLCREAMIASDAEAATKRRGSPGRRDAERQAAIWRRLELHLREAADA